jgi:hypothetical protein
VPIILINGAMHVVAVLGDKPVDMVLDTGAVVSSISTTLANQLIASGQATEAQPHQFILANGQTELDQPTQGTIRMAWTRRRSTMCWVAICAFTSELFYESRLHPRRGLELQEIRSASVLNGSGLRYLPVAHTGNQSSSPEEAEVVRGLVSDFLASNPTWINRDGRECSLTLDDILIIAPYNAQVFELQTRLPGARIGTVDKFQGQEAPLVIYSMTTSSHADAPRGMEFLIA